MNFSDRTSKIKRLLLKVSGESLGATSSGSVLSGDALLRTCKDIIDLCSQGIEVVVVPGGGNIFRGRLSDDLKMSQYMADKIGMLATVINGLALENALAKSCDVLHVVGGGASIKGVRPFCVKNAEEHFKKNSGGVVIISGGLGIPYCTTDTACVMRALELSCDLCVKRTRYAGVFDKDPQKYSDVKHYPLISASQMIDEKLKAMDSFSLTLLKEYDFPCLVCSLDHSMNEFFENAYWKKKCPQHTFIWKK